jgi:hypothetical protein
VRLNHAHGSGSQSAARVGTCTRALILPPSCPRHACAWSHLMRNIRRVRDFIEAKRHVLTHSAKRGDENKKQKNEGANAPVSIGRDRTLLIVRWCV